MKIDNISIGLPCYNEENNIEKVINKCLKFIKKNKIKNWELLLVDNKSNDQTVKIIKKIIYKSKNSKIKLLKNKKNILYSGSTNEIIKRSKYDIVSIMDSDDQYDPNDISKLFYIMKKKNFDLIIGKRTIRKDSIFRKIISKVFLILSKVLVGNNLSDLNCGLRVLKKNRNIKNYIDHYINFCNPELFVKYKKYNLKIGEIKIKHFNRSHGTSIHSFSNLLKTFLRVTLYLWSLKKLLN